MKTETRTSEGVAHPIRYQLAADHALHDQAVAIADAYLDTIIDSIVNQPRSLQKRIGPSEMGIPCGRRLAYKLGGVPDPERRGVPWKPTIGTAVHSYLEEAFQKASAPGAEQQGRWLTEERVRVAEIGGQIIDGATDLFDTWGHAVMDHKIIGKSTGRKYRTSGPSAQYRAQAHLYGKGWHDDGWQVDMVAICFLPREGELTDTFIWTEPYNPGIAMEAISRNQRIYELVQILGPEGAASAYPACDDVWCPWCSGGPPQRAAQLEQAFNPALAATGSAWDQFSG